LDNLPERLVRLSPVNRELRRLLDGSGGIVHRADALAVLPEHVLDQAVSTGQVRAVLPLVYVDPIRDLDRTMLIRAALRYAATVAALSHTTALAVWGLPAPIAGPVHLTVPPTARLRGSREVRVHRRLGFTPTPPDAVVRNGWPVTRLETSIVDSWPMLSADAQRAPAIVAVGQRLTTPGRLRAALTRRPRLGGRRRLAELIDKLAAGCRSELELWGYDVVFRDPALASLRWQVPVRVPTGRVYLDLYDEETRTNFELDGAKHHAGSADRERDLRRDATLAAAGITVVRFTHDRLVRAPAEVRAQAVAILAARRAA
jgi:very-short-patch-repair endonuclease